MPKLYTPIPKPIVNMEDNIEVYHPDKKESYEAQVKSINPEVLAIAYPPSRNKLLKVKWNIANGRWECGRNKIIRRG